MASLAQYLTVSFNIIFINNLVLSKFLGLCPFVGVSKKTDTALGMGAAVTFVMTMSSLITWLVYRFILLPYQVMYLRTITFILVIAAFVQLVEIIIRKVSPVLFKAFGIYLPLITTNCTVLGITIMNTDDFFKSGAPVPGSFTLALVQALAAGAGYSLAMLLMSAIRERLELADIPRPLQGISIAFIITGLLSMSFLGFAGFRF